MTAVLLHCCTARRSGSRVWPNQKQKAHSTQQFGLLLARSPKKYLRSFLSICWRGPMFTVLTLSTSTLSTSTEHKHFPYRFAGGAAYS
jgi:hypothetical protein